MTDFSNKWQLYQMLIVFKIYNILILSKDQMENAHSFQKAKGAQNHKKKIAKTRIARLSKRPIKRMTMTKIQKKQQCLGKFQQKGVQTVNGSMSFDPQQQYYCAICLQLMINPTTLQCSHSYCLTCLQKLVNLTSDCICALCRSLSTKSFYEIDYQKQQLIGIIHQSKLTPEQQSEYLLRKQLIERSELRDRGIKRKLKMNQQIKIRARSVWRRAKVTSILHRQNKTLYQVRGMTIDQSFTVPSDSINIRVLNQEQLASLKNSNGQYYDIFQEQICVNTPNNIDNTYNIQDLLLQFNTYPYLYQYYPQNNINSQQQQRHLQGQSSSNIRNTSGSLIKQQDTQSNISQ